MKNQLNTWKSGLTVLLIGAGTAIILNPEGISKWATDLPKTPIKAAAMKFTRGVVTLLKPIHSDLPTQKTHQAFIHFQNEIKFQFKPGQECSSRAIASKGPLK